MRLIGVLFGVKAQIGYQMPQYSQGEDVTRVANNKNGYVHVHVLKSCVDILLHVCLDIANVFD